MSHTIKYVAPGATLSSEEPSSYEEGTGVAEGSFPEAKKAGYTFEGWYADENFRTEVTSIPATATSDYVLYAYFKPNTFNIKYVTNGGYNSENNPESYEFGQGVASFEPAVKDGERFYGWYEDEEFSKEITKISDDALGDFVLYAKFAPVEYPMVVDPEEYVLGTKKALVATVKDADITKYKKDSVLLNGEKLPSTAYEVTKGSTIITINADYMETLSVGDYTIKAFFTDGTSVGKFKVTKKEEDNPATTPSTDTTPTNTTPADSTPAVTPADTTPTVTPADTTPATTPEPAPAATVTPKSEDPEPETTEAPKTPVKSNGVATADPAQPLAVLVIMLVSAALAATLMIRRKKDK